jgi:hypothetical protein
MALRDACPDPGRSKEETVEDVTESESRPVPPPGLGARGAALFEAITRKYQLRPDEMQYLIDACGEADLIELLQAEINGGSLITTGSRGQDAPAPAVSEVRQHRAVLANLLGKLHLPDESGRSAQTTSELARRAANARWHPRGTV